MLIRTAIISLVLLNLTTSVWASLTLSIPTTEVARDTPSAIVPVQLENTDATFRYLTAYDLFFDLDLPPGVMLNAQTPVFTSFGGSLGSFISMNNFFGADLLVSDSGFSNSNTMEIAPSAGKKTLFFLNFQFDWSQIPQGTGAIATVRRGSLLGHSMSMADGVDVSDNGAANVIAFNASQVDFLTTISPGLMPDIIKIVAVPEPSEWILAFLLTAFTTQIGLERRRARKPM